MLPLPGLRRCPGPRTSSHPGPACRPQTYERDVQRFKRTLATACAYVRRRSIPWPNRFHPPDLSGPKSRHGANRPVAACSYKGPVHRRPPRTATNATSRGVSILLLGRGGFSTTGPVGSVGDWRQAGLGQRGCCGWKLRGSAHNPGHECDRPDVVDAGSCEDTGARVFLEQSGESSVQEPDKFAEHP